jgi:hypothetical protein
MPVTKHPAIGIIGIGLQPTKIGENGRTCIQTVRIDVDSQFRQRQHNTSGLEKTIWIQMSVRQSNLNLKVIHHPAAGTAKRAGRQRRLSLYWCWQGRSQPIRC